MEETVSFLKSLLATHGPNYFERLFGPKARNNMLELGGVDNVAIVLSGELAIHLYQNQLHYNLNFNKLFGKFKWKLTLKSWSCNKYILNHLN